MLTRSYLGDIVNLLSETRFRIVNGVFTSETVRIVVRGVEDTGSSHLPRYNPVRLMRRYATFPVCGCMFGLRKRPGNLKRCCHEACSDSKL